MTANLTQKKRNKDEKISNVFKTVGQPTITYVERDSGKLEKKLQNAITFSGQICLLTGPSKTGKTTLYKRALQQLRREPLVVRCDKTMSPEQFWRKALETVNFSRIQEIANSTSIGGEVAVEANTTFGWSWLAAITGRVATSATSQLNESEARQVILSDPSPMHLIPILKKLPITLVMEDYHYLSAEAQETIFQQWKYFVDEEVSVIVVGTTHHAIDVITANKDLLGRKIHLEIPSWSEVDLRKIVTQGFDYLEVPISLSVIRFIAKESVGLPIVTQHACEALFTRNSIYEHQINSHIPCERSDVEEALRSVATDKFAELGQWYNRLIVGPRKRARKYDTYELVLACFADEPVKFQLQRHEISERLEKLCPDGSGLPPAPSVNSMLNAISSFQEKQSFDLLEWRGDEGVLYMLEPLFLFYIKWGVPQKTKDGNKNENSAAALLKKLLLDWTDKKKETMTHIAKVTSSIGKFDSSVNEITVKRDNQGGEN
jgi:hypothetical protein